jgi:hypothetical protein
MAPQETRQELSKAPEAAFQQVDENKVTKVPDVQEALGKLSKVGGFDFIENILETARNLNPANEARVDTFLTDVDKKPQRIALKKRLDMWIDLLSENDSISGMLEAGTQKLESSEKLLKENQKTLLDSTRELEQSYQAVWLFYTNTGLPKLDNVFFMNASISQLADLKDDYIGHVADELKKNYDRFDLRDNYSMIIIPGNLGKKTVVDEWARIAYKNKAMVITDFRNEEKLDHIKSEWKEEDLPSGDVFKSNIIMTCNYIVGRGAHKEVDEKEDLYIPGSAALAGKMYSTLMSQVSAGKKHGTMNSAEGVRIKLLKSEVSELERIGLVPMINEWNQVMAFSGKTLFNGSNIGLQSYSVVRVFDYIAKVLVDFLNRRAFENWKDDRELRQQITRFMDGIKGPDRLIEKYKIERFERNELTKDIYLNMNITPFFAAKTFVISLAGHEGEQKEWTSDYEQK